MIRLLVHVEGQTEETFVNDILAPHLYARGFSTVGARLIGNSRQRDKRGGIKSWPVVKRDILNHLKADPKCVATTMVDYYGLPASGDRAWPGRSQAVSVPFAAKAAMVGAALHADICAAMEATFNPARFVPYVMMHEFEGLLFSDCDRFARAIGEVSLALDLQAIRDQFGSPEEINDGPTTAPSKRIMELIPGYQKPLYGTLAILGIGLETLRAECPHFRNWLERLESLPASTGT